MQLYGRPQKVLSQVKFAIGIFCGLNSSYKATEYLISKYTGVPLDRIKKFEYRGGPESQDKRVTTRGGKIKIIPREARATMWRGRCMLCWDFSAELADVSLGDIFLPAGFRAKLPGFSAILTRTKEGEQLIDGAEKSGYIRTSSLAESGFTHNVGIESKKQFAAYRLLEWKRFGWPTPNYHYEIKYKPPEFIDKKAAILQQMRDIPEIVEWVAQNPKYQKQLAAVDPKILRIIEQLL